jgi:hypothetical protein
MPFPERLEISNENDFSGSLKKSDPVLQIALNQVECEYFQTDPGHEGEREYNYEYKAIEKILKNQKKAFNAIHSVMTNTKYKRKSADAYYLLDSKLCTEWKHYIQEKIKDCPRNYATDDDLHEQLKQGKILRHKEDFYLVAEGEQWNKF